MRQRWPRAWNPDPGYFSVTSAARVAIVAPALLAIVVMFVGNVRMSLFTWFSVIALLEFVDFEGPRRSRLNAYLTLAVAGAALIVVGTLCSGSLPLAVFMTAVVAFVIMFAGVLHPYVAVAGRSALLAFALSVMTPGPVSAIPERLAGWCLGAAGSITAAMFLWPRRPPDRLRANMAAASRALADGVTWHSSAACQAPPPAVGAGVETAGVAAAGVAAAKAEAAAAEAEAAAEKETANAWAQLRRLRREFAATVHRPTGLGGRAAALGYVFIDLNWLLPFALPWPERDRAARAGFPAEAAELHSAVAATLRAVAARFDPSDQGGTQPAYCRCAGGRQGDHAAVGDDRLGMARLERAERAMRTALLRRLRSEDPASADGFPRAELAAAEAFRLRRLARGTRDLALDVLKATAPARGRGRPAKRPRPRPGAARLRNRVRDRGAAAADLAAGYASSRSVWFRNSVRRALGLALAVVVSQAVGVDHAFWVVLGTLSVLRTNAVATNTAAARALAGTVLGIVVGGLAVAAAGGHTAGLWAVLPPAVFLGSYARRRAGFALGQAGFTIAVILLFNIVEPAGWKIGIVRVEDVLIGFAVSMVAGALLWPRGAVAVLRNRAEAAYLTAVAFLETVVSLLPGSHPAGREPAPEPQPQAARQEQPVRAVDATGSAVDATGSAVDAAARGREAIRAGRLLDDTVRHFLAEDPPERFDIDALMMIVAAAQRIRRTALVLRRGDVNWPADLPAVDETTGLGAALVEAQDARAEDLD
ncbi:FUSC family protein, partial [Frankia sp. EI5c]|uniref:FUSC family protein n=1 Tax=Frankia sp. EI5c TaxID=683316 RepID=UPI000825D14F